MLKKSIMIICFLVCLLSLNVVKCLNINDNLIGIEIYLDPGHGGVDPGAIYKDIKESDINLQFAKILKKQFEEEGVIVYLTRDGDYDLSSTTINRKRSDLYNRFKVINKSKSNLYLSIHLNSESSGIWYGPQVFYTNKNKNNKNLASIIQDDFTYSLNSKRDISEIDNLYMYKNIDIPGVLIELGFISNYQDRNKLINKEYQEKMALSIVKSIKKYIGS